MKAITDYEFVYNSLVDFMLAPKPEWCRGQDVSTILYLSLVADSTGLAAPTQAAIASSTGAGTVNMNGVKASTQRLHDAGWITWTKGKEGHRHTYQINYEKLPGLAERFERFNRKEEVAKTET